ncbi:MAG: homoserine kinase [Thaumarchaeota archaeon 13_1_40CM_38_12]|nr:MAG: homoserine kinase [Thaumarchaeota archaeon 13_1_40CM_38_12]
MSHKLGSTSVTAVAPSSTANLGPGFDVFGLGLDAFEDKVTITTRLEQSEQITLRISGEGERTVPARLEDNCAGVVVKKMSQDFDLKNSFEINLEKKVPAGLGIGSSAASAVAAAVAFDRLFDLKIEKAKLVEYAAEGEIVSAGTKHYDNVSGSLLGGFVIVRTSPRLEFIRLDPPKDLIMIIAIPLIEVPDKKTEIARSVLPNDVSLKSVVHNVSNASTIVAGFLIVEPHRKGLIPGYDAVKRNALKAGALAVTISGAGPSMISFLKNDKYGKRVADSMSDGFKEANVQSRTFVCHSSKGARVLLNP